MRLLGNLFDKQKGTRVNHEEDDAAIKLSSGVQHFLQSPINRPVIIVCIGTDRSTGDSLGPLVGTFLQEKKISPFHIYGTLDHPVHAVNLEDTMKEIHSKYKNPFIIAIDACLGRMKSVGTIQLSEGAVKPGAGVNKELPEVGDIHITGIVNISGFMEFFVLQNTRLSLVLKMAKTIANAIYDASLSIESRQTWKELSWTTDAEKSL